MITIVFLSLQDLIDDLMFSESDASDILAKHAEVAAAANVIAKSTNVNKILEDSRNSVSNVIKIPEESLPFVYEELTLDIGGPPPPTLEEVTHLFKLFLALLTINIFD